jgi:hypothetical protein
MVGSVRDYFYPSTLLRSAKNADFSIIYFLINAR